MGRVLRTMPSLTRRHRRASMASLLAIMKAITASRSTHPISHSTSSSSRIITTNNSKSMAAARNGDNLSSRMDMVARLSHSMPHIKARALTMNTALATKISTVLDSKSPTKL